MRKRVKIAPRVIFARVTIMRRVSILHQNLKKRKKDNKKKQKVKKSN